MDQVANLRELVITVTNLKAAGVDNKEALKAAVQVLGGAASNNKSELNKVLLQLLLDRIEVINVDTLIAQQQVGQGRQEGRQQVIVPQAQPPEVQENQLVGEGAENQGVGPRPISASKIQLRTNMFKDPNVVNQDQRIIVAQEVQRCPICFELRNGVEVLDGAIEDIMALVASDSSLVLTETAWIDNILVNAKKIGDFYSPKRRENKPLPPYVAKIDQMLEQLATKAWEMFGVAIYTADLFVAGRPCTIEMRALMALLGQFCGNLKDRRNMLLYNLPTQTPGQHYLTGEKFDAAQALEATHPQQRPAVNTTNISGFGMGQKRLYRNAFFYGQRQSPRVFTRREIEPGSSVYAGLAGLSGGPGYTGYAAGGSGHVGYGNMTAGVFPQVVGPPIGGYRQRRVPFAGTVPTAGLVANAGSGSGSNAGSSTVTGIAGSNM
jgi:hypothetical protein